MQRCLILLVILAVSITAYAQTPSGTGDVDCSGGPLDISDLVYVVDYMFNGGPPPCPLDQFDLGMSYVADTAAIWAEWGPEADRSTIFAFDLNPESPGLLKVIVNANLNEIMDTCFTTTYFIIDTADRSGSNDTTGLFRDTISYGMAYYWEGMPDEAINIKSGLTFEMPVQPGPLQLYLDLFFSGCHYISLTDVTMSVTLLPLPRESSVSKPLRRSQAGSPAAL